LEQTPTWAVAAVCTVFVVCSLAAERALFKFGRYLKRKKQKELYHTLEVIRNELMLVGFISLFLTVFQPKIASICMPERLNRYMLPCAYKPEPPPGPPPPGAARRRLLAESTVNCPAGKVQVISESGLHELHIFIFVMAVVHVLYSCVTVLLGLWQVHSWKRWENEQREENHRSGDSVDAAMGKKSHKHASSNFVRKRASYSFLKETRTGWNLDSYLYCFFRQFGRPIYKHDYLCLRLGFIAEHKLPPTYDFHSYIRRTMEEDFKVVVGISWYLWAFVCVFLLMGINGWYTYFWIAFIPTIGVLLIGMKLQQIITSLALEVIGGVEKRGMTKRRSKPEQKAADKMLDDKVPKIHPIKPRDDLFWFNRPRLLLHLVHFMLFQNSYEFAFFFWAMFSYGFTSCLVGKLWMIIVRILMGIFVQILCSASTLPLYALVSQLGSNIRMETALPEVAVSGVHKWHDKAKKKRKALDEGEVHGDSNGNHTIDVEMSLQANSQHHANGNHNGFQHSDLKPTSQGPADSHNVEIHEQ
jgi:mlo protein